MDTIPQIAVNFHAVLKDHTAGSPTEEDLIWTDLTVTDIAERLTASGTPVSVHIVEHLLDEDAFHRRKAQKAQSMEEAKDRDAQFRNIARLTEEYLHTGDPILSMDTKKRELLGNFYRAGRLLTKQTLRTFDHDFPSYAEGVVIPHGLYDPRLNRGYVHLGTSHDTSAFARDCLEDWWVRFGQVQYPRAKSLLLKCDGGGSNSARTYLFKTDLQALVNRVGLEVRVAHYPPYCSKHNPIEHRLFPHLTRACQGVIFTHVGLVKRLMEKARTRTGLAVVVDVIDKVYETGRKVTAEAKKALNYIRDQFLPQWNYRLLPQAQT
ncbi:MAG TPA: ISAzo13 family transposase [Candidatus Binatia bacterium]|nr:ISAzo13 family transposase [Candidatus Binatia bacterium]